MCLFCNIVDGKAPCQKVYEDDWLFAFEDINPQANIHILLIPKKHIESLATIEESDLPIISRMFETAKRIAESKGILTRGFRTVFNCNREGGQVVFHLHLHLIGGEQLGGNMSGLTT